MSSTTATKASKARVELAEAFMTQLAQLKRRFTAAVPEEVREKVAAVTPHQVDALSSLAQCEGGMTMNELARAQGCALSTATALVDRLLKHDLAQRRDDPTDRRIVRIAPTAEAKKLIAQMHSHKREIGIEVLAPLSDQEIEQLVKLLGKLSSDGGAA